MANDAYEVVKDAFIPFGWRVEKINSDGDGGIDVTIFDGPNAEARAREYAAWKYGVSRNQGLHTCTEVLLFDRLLWLRNHYDVGRAELKKQVLDDIDAILDRVRQK